MKIKLSKKKGIILGVLVLVLAGGGYWAYKTFSAKPATTTTITGKVQRGDVRKVISATGTVSYPIITNLTFEQTEKLVALNVDVGDNVKEGQVLMQIDSSNLQQVVNQQQANLASAQAKLQQVQDDSLPNALSALAQAQQSVNSKQVALNTAKNNADPAYLANQLNLAQQNVLQASNNLAQVMASGDSSKIQGAQSSLTQAQQTLLTAQNAQNGGAAMALNAAQSDYDVAQQNLKLAQDKVDKLQQGKISAEILTAQNSVQQAQAQLQTAQTNLGKATMIAPFDGVITAVSGQVGQVSGSGSGTKPGVTIAANPDVLQVDTSVGQADINNIKLGQKAEISLDTQPNVKITGTVSTIAVQGTSTQNVTTFGVKIMVDQKNTILKAGMNANVNIILDEAKNVLTIPSEALKSRNGEYSVLVPSTAGDTNSGAETASPSGSSAGGKSSRGQGQGSNQASGTSNAGATGNQAGMPSNFKSVPVEIGLNDGSNVEIKSGLTEGQEIIVAVRSSSSSTTTSGQRSSSNPFGGQGGAGMGNINRAVNSGGGGRPGN
jgi:HlyD family secretion protein